MYWRSGRQGTAARLLSPASPPYTLPPTAALLQRPPPSPLPCPHRRPPSSCHCRPRPPEPSSSSTPSRSALYPSPSRPRLLSLPDGPLPPVRRRQLAPLLPLKPTVELRTAHPSEPSSRNAVVIGFACMSRLQQEDEQAEGDGGM
ncbi:hypothetical protein E2562_012310 [Oryza meyeriana var. granulata]|uniref:Uncharacterized protein n=1 Tax=Oryza meyeriana var. granulata TaxID=110450 RepID=A0A6G1DHY7_9ORYZ|nr:hypothetical protein E2562_012310 [Oryza meyeriana var. granulata]